MDFLNLYIFVTTTPSEALAAHILTYRFLKMNRKLAITAMEELLRRRNLGEEFDFEGWIESEVAKLKTISNQDKSRSFSVLQIIGALGSKS